MCLRSPFLPSSVAAFVIVRNARAFLTRAFLISFSLSFSGDKLDRFAILSSKTQGGHGAAGGLLPRVVYFAQIYALQGARASVY